MNHSERPTSHDKQVRKAQPARNRNKADALKELREGMLKETWETTRDTLNKSIERKKDLNANMAAYMQSTKRIVELLKSRTQRLTEEQQMILKSWQRQSKEMRMRLKDLRKRVIPSMMIMGLRLHFLAYKYDTNSWEKRDREMLEVFRPVREQMDKAIPFLGELSESMRPLYLTLEAKKRGEEDQEMRMYIREIREKEMIKVGDPMYVMGGRWSKQEVEDQAQIVVHLFDHMARMMELMLKVRIEIDSKEKSRILSLWKPKIEVPEASYETFLRWEVVRKREGREKEEGLMSAQEMKEVQKRMKEGYNEATLRQEISAYNEQDKVNAVEGLYKKVLFDGQYAVNAAKSLYEKVEESLKAYEGKMVKGEKEVVSMLMRREGPSGGAEERRARKSRERP